MFNSEEALSPRDVYGLTSHGLVVVAGEVEVELRFAGTAARRLSLLRLMTGALEEDEVTDDVRAVACEIIRELAQLGLLAKPAPVRAVPGHTLVDAVVEAARGGDVRGWVWTAAEALYLPPDLSTKPCRRALRAFVAGSSQTGRVRAYGYAAARRAVTVWGDTPGDKEVAEVVSAVGTPSAGVVLVVDLRSKHLEAWSVDDLFSERRVGRLGIVTEVRPLPLVSIPAGAAAAFARYAAPNLNAVDEAVERFAYGVGSSSERAKTVAQAEAIERFRAGDAGAQYLQRAAPNVLGDLAVLPVALIDFCDRQYVSGVVPANHRAEGSRLWAPGRRGDTDVWAPAELALYPFVDPVEPRPPGLATSSGVAAHSSFETAVENALFELVERDAFMWAWINQVGRERITARSLPDEAAPWQNALRTAGYQVELVNISLDTAPVILCAARRRGALVLGAAAAGQAVRAAARAVQETALAALARHDDEDALHDPTRVRTVGDHQRLYRSRRFVDHATFLLSSSERIALDEVPALDRPISESLPATPVVVPLHSDRRDGLTVVRGMVPGLIPISFGFDREPLGMPRLNARIRTRDGRDLAPTPTLPGLDDPLIPHPFA